MIWSKDCVDGSRLEVSRMYAPSRGYRDGYEFPVERRRSDGSRSLVCKVDEDGVPRRWYVNEDEREEVKALLEDLPNSLLVEVVSRN